MMVVVRTALIGLLTAAIGFGLAGLTFFVCDLWDVLMGIVDRVYEYRHGR